MSTATPANERPEIIIGLRLGKGEVETIEILPEIGKSYRTYDTYWAAEDAVVSGDTEIALLGNCLQAADKMKKESWRLLREKKSPKPNQTLGATVVASYSYDSLNRLLQKSFDDSVCLFGEYQLSRLGRHFYD
jgi:hypothetical protein